MDDLSSPLGLALIAVAAYVAIKAVKVAVKVAMLVVVLGGLYLWFGANAAGP
jgi:hypothetical protein